MGVARRRALGAMPPKGADKVTSKGQVVDPDGVEANAEVKVG